MSSRTLTPVEKAQYRSLKFVYGIHMQNTLNELVEQLKLLRYAEAELNQQQQNPKILSQLKNINEQLDDIEQAIEILCKGFDEIAQA